MQDKPGGEGRLRAEIGAPIDFAAAFDRAPIGLAVLDRDLRYVACNERLAEINRIPAEHHLGRTIRELLPWLPVEVDTSFRTVFETGVPLRERKVYGQASAAGRSFLDNAVPLKDPSGRVRHIVVSVQDITSLDRAERALSERERVFRASQQLRPDCFIILRALRDEEGRVLDFVLEYANPSAERLLPAHALVGRRLLEALPGNRDHPLLFPRYVRLLSEREPDEVALQYEADGLLGWYSNCAVAIDEDRLAVSFRDITEEKALQEQLELVTQEFRHRVKNILAVISGVVAQSAKSAVDVPGFSRALIDRLVALSAAQDLLTVGEDDVPLERVAAAALGPFLGRLQVRGGPPVAVPAASVVPLALAFNELATNAVKYGGLSVPQGAVELGWTVGDHRVSLTWSESGAPPVAEPLTEGFGSRLISDAAYKLPRGVVERRIDGAEFRVTISFDLPSCA